MAHVLSGTPCTAYPRSWVRQCAASALAAARAPRPAKLPRHRRAEQWTHAVSCRA